MGRLHNQYDGTRTEVCFIAPGRCPLSDPIGHRTALLSSLPDRQNRHSSTNKQGLKSCVPRMIPPRTKKLEVVCRYLSKSFCDFSFQASTSSYMFSLLYVILNRHVHHGHREHLHPFFDIPVKRSTMSGLAIAWLSKRWM